MSVEGAEEEKSDKVDDKTEEKQPESDKIIEQNEKMDAEPKPNQNNVIKNGKEPKKGENANGEKCSNVTEEENDGHESPIRLTLEDDDETLHDVEVGIFILKTKSTYHAYFFFRMKLLLKNPLPRKTQKINLKVSSMYSLRFMQKFYT